MNKPREALISECGTKILRDFTYESIIPYEYLEAIIGYEKGEIAFSAILGAIKEYLVEFGYVLKPVVNEGYEVLHPRDVADFVMNRHLVGSLSKLNKGCRILHYVDRKSLNKEEKQRLESLEQFLIELEHDNENKIIAIQYQINEARAKELNK